MSNKTILINATSHEVRVAVMSQGTLNEFFVERSRKRTVVGNIYKGKVVKVLPGMQSAFVDIGLSKAAFLHVADMISYDDGMFDLEDETDEFHSKRDMLDDDVADFENDQDSVQSATRSTLPIEEQLKEGQEIIVQVTKDAIGSKGARLTMHLSLPGRYLVLMPNYAHIGISRKIGDNEERDRLRVILRKILPDDSGLIARTVSRGQNEDDLTADRDYLVRIWKNVVLKSNESGSPKLLYEDDNLIFRILRDVVSDDTGEIIIDNEDNFKQLKMFCKEYHPNIKTKFTLYTKEKPLFDAYNMEIEVSKLLDRKIWLRSGGYIIIDPTEALTVIDVNTGRFVGKRNFEETILKTNLEAAREIAHQLRLRNIGGIIIVDFIDMDSIEHQDIVLDMLDELLKDDRSRASVVNLTPLGLVEIIRKRSQESLIRLMSEPCPYCEGRGVVKARLSVCYEILRQIRRLAPENKGKSILLEAHNEVADILLSNERESISMLENQYKINLQVTFKPHYHIEQYELYPLEKEK